MIYFLTAVALTPGGSSTVHIYTQTIHRTKQGKQNIHYRKHITIRTQKIIKYIIYKIKQKHTQHTTIYTMTKNGTISTILNNVLWRGYIWYTRRFGNSTYLKPRAYQILVSQIMEHIQHNNTGAFKDYDWMAVCGPINSIHMTKRHRANPGCSHAD